MIERFCILIKPEGNGRGCLTKFLSGFSVLDAVSDAC